MKHDMSLWFINDIVNIVKNQDIVKNDLVKKNIQLNQYKNMYIERIMKKYNINDINHIKPGIGESTRVLLRRIPFLIIVKNIRNIAIKHIIQLSKEKDIKIIEDKTLPYTTLAIIKNIL
jgi:hypothetical protein